MPILYKLRWLVIGASIVLFLASLGEPAILFQQMISTSVAHHTVTGRLVAKSGLYMLFAGFFGPFSLNFAGIANPLLWVGWLLLGLGKRKPALITLGIAAALTLQTFQLLRGTLPFDEADVNKGLMVRPLLGFFLWIGSILLPLLAAALIPKPASSPA